MSSQFEKRKAKAEAAIKEKRAGIRGDEAPTAVETPIETPTLPVQFTHEGFDIYLGPDGRKFFAINFDYNPETREIAIKSIDPVQRGVALSYENHKRALKTILRKK